MRSKSVLGLSSVLLIFERDTDLMAARQLVQERLARAAPQLAGGRLPARTDAAAVLDQPAAQDRRVLADAVSDGAHRHRPVGPATAADGGARRRQRRRVGPRARQLQVQVDSNACRPHGVRLEGLAAAADATQLGAGGIRRHAQSTPCPSPTAAGAADAQGSSARSASPSAAGPRSRLADVTDVVEGFLRRPSVTRSSTADPVLLIVEKQPWATPSPGSPRGRGSARAIAPARRSMSSSTRRSSAPATSSSWPSPTLDARLRWAAAWWSLILGCFLFDLRTAAISILAIPGPRCWPRSPSCTPGAR